MNTPLEETLDVLLQAHVGSDHQRTPLLNNLGVLTDALADLCTRLQALARHAPLLEGQTSAQLRAASAQYWGDLAPGTEGSRLDHSKALRAEDLALRAQLLAALGQISDAGQQLLDDALQSGAQRDAPSVYAVALETSDGTRLTLPGVELLQAPSSDRCLMVFPGLGQQLFEFDSRVQAGHALIEFMLGPHGDEFWSRFSADVAAHWQQPPFAGLGVKAHFGLLDKPPLNHGLDSSIASELNAQVNARSAPDENWPQRRVERFWLALPSALQACLTAALAADAERQAHLVTFASINPSMSSVLVAQRIATCEMGIQRYIGDNLASSEQQRYRQVHAAWQATQGKVQRQVDQLMAQPVSSQEVFWGQRDEHGMTPRQSIVAGLGTFLRHDAQLQVYEGTLSSVDLTLINEVLGHPAAAQRQASGNVVAQLAVGLATFSYRLPGAYVVASARAWNDEQRSQPCLLVMAGIDGGIRRFGSLTELLQSLTASLQDLSFTPVWARYSTSAQAAIMRFVQQASLPWVTTVVTADWLDDYVGSEIDSHADRVALASDDAARARLLEELASALSAPVHDVREVAIARVAEQRRLQATLQGLPAWIGSASPAVRQQFAELLEHYNQVATAQESFLQREPPLIQPFAHALLKAHLRTVLNVELDPQQVLLKLPESVEVKAVPTIPSEVLVPSSRQQTLSLVELALLNVDRQVTLRMRYATLLDSATRQPLAVPGLTVDRVRRLIIELDVAGQYRRKVQTLYSLPVNSGDDVRSQLLSAPYLSALRLQAFSDRQRGLLSKDGWALLEKALQARSVEQLAQGSLAARLSTTTLSLGVGSERLASGLLLFEHCGTGECWLYLPKVAEGASFIQGASTDAVKAALLRRLSSTSMRTWLAGLGGVGQASASREHYLEQARQCDYSGFIHFAVSPYPVWPVAAALLHHRQQQLLNDAQLISRSREEVRQAFAQQLRDGGKQLAMSGLYYLPGIGTALQLYDGWADAQAAVNAFSRGDTALGLRRMASAELNFGFALVSFIPGIAAAKVARQSLAPRQRASSPSVHIGRKGARLDGFAGHAVDIDLTTAVRQHGLDAGTWKHGGKLYVRQDGNVYEVFRRSGELTLRLRRTSTNSHEHPVRQGPDGRFVTHLDTGLRAGGRSRAGSSASADDSVMADYLIAAEDRALMSELLPRAHGYALDERGALSAPKPSDQAKQRFFTKRKQLLRDADDYLREVVVPARVELPPLAEHVSHAALIAQVYQKSNGLVIGESHATSASKRFLIDNFATLKAQGVKTLYFEHLHMDFLARDLKTLNETGVMTPALKQHLASVDKGHWVDAGQPFTFENVVVQARKQGLQVIGLDCAASWYAKGVADNGIGARQRMFSYLASRVIQAHQASAGEHKWVALVGNSHSNTYRSTPGLAELNRAVGVRVAEPEGGIRPRWRVDPGYDPSFGEARVKADFFLEVEVPTHRQASSSPTSTSSAALEALHADVQDFLGARPAQLQLGRPRLVHPGSFYIEKVEGKRQVVHLSRDGNIYRTAVEKQLGRYSLSRPSWDKVHGRKFWTLQALLAAMAEQNLTHVQS